MSPIRYSGGTLDRAAKLREDDDWVSAAFVSDGAVAVLVHNDRNLVTGLAGREETPRAALVPLALVREKLPASGGIWAFLGLAGEIPVFAIDVSADGVAPIPELDDLGEFVDLRRAGPLLPAEEAAVLAYARAVLTWHRRHRHCSVCGSPTESHKAGHARRCTDTSCAAESFPRTDPVVIMLVTRSGGPGAPGVCLLGRHARLPRGAYSLLAGFVEPGESLEDAVAREVMEETSVRVCDTRYQGSQPWPFPYSMMIGFRATAETEDIVLDDELEDARWFTAQQVAEFGEWADESATFRKPRKDSIARYLLDQWVSEESRGQSS